MWMRLRSARKCKERAENIVRYNLCLFFEDGNASCAYIYPNKVNGVKGGFYDPYANDQDWALVYYLLVQNGIYKRIMESLNTESLIG